MRLQGEALSERLEKYTDDTIHLISEAMSQSRELNRKCRDITTDSELNEEEVVKRLKELLSENKK